MQPDLVMESTIFKFLDTDHDEADRAAGRKIGCPVLAIWGGGRAVGTDGTHQQWEAFGTNRVGHKACFDLGSARDIRERYYSCNQSEYPIA